MKKSLITCLVTVICASMFIAAPISASEEGRRNTSYLMGVLLGGAIYTGNPYAISTTGAGTLYSLKRLGDEINDRHQQEKYCQSQYYQPQSYPSSCQQPSCYSTQNQQAVRCPTCGQGQIYQNYTPKEQNCPSNSSNPMPQYNYYPTTTQYNDYDSRDPDELIPNTASESSHQNISIGYNGNRPTFRINRSGNQRTSYVRRGNKQKQSQKVIVVYVDANGYPIQDADYQPQPAYQRDPDQLVPVSASDSSHQNFSVGYSGNNPTGYINRSGGQRVNYIRRGNLRN